jgi:GTP 3',8-cyclase
MTDLVRDTAGRPLRNLRVSVTDRCNLRCAYCMPEEDYVWLPKDRLLHYGQLTVIVAAAVELGVRKVRLTGGEPLLRRELWRFVKQLRALDGLEEITMTSNGMLLGEQAEELFGAGLDRVTISIDTLREDRFKAATRRDGLAATLEGIAAAAKFGSAPVKLNTVLQRGVNDDEILDLLQFAREGGHELRFIEYMDVDGATRWNQEQVVSRREILEHIASECGPVTAAPKDEAAPADRFRLQDGTVFGVISSTTQPFCGTCDRARLTADGRLFTCLYATEGLPLGPGVLDGMTTEQLRLEICQRWLRRTDRGAEERLALGSERSPTAVPELRAAPHLEMHTRGG